MTTKTLAERIADRLAEAQENLDALQAEEKQNIRLRSNPAYTVPDDAVEVVEDKGVEEMQNKLTKYYWRECYELFDNTVDFSSIDGSNDFTAIPKNSKGYIKDFTIGNLREIIQETWKQAFLFGTKRKEMRDEKWVKERVNEFIKNWCEHHAPHLLDSDDNDGEDLRQTIVNYGNQRYEEGVKRATKTIRRRMLEIGTQYHIQNFDRTLSHKSGMAIGFSVAVKALDNLLSGIEVGAPLDVIDNNQ